MAQASTARRPGSRKATGLALRSLAALVALLLLGSSLGQVAHFLLVQHAICAEHGELLELHQASQHHATRAASDSEPQSAPAPEADQHDHCQLLARQQRELGLPVVPPIAIAPAVAERAPDTLAAVKAPASARALLSLAPKTSPPRHAAFG